MERETRYTSDSTPTFLGANKSCLAQNLTTLRKARKLTQLELAEVLHYSDKSISKWENGDTAPDLDTLIALSNFYEISLDMLCKTVISQDDLDQKDTEQVKSRRRFTRNKIIVTALAVMTVWTIVIFSYVEVLLLRGVNYWLFFVWAVPLSFGIALVFCSIWGNKTNVMLCLSGLLWTFLATVHIDFLNQGYYNFWPIYLIGIPGQITIWLATRLKFHRDH